MDDLVVVGRLVPSLLVGQDGSVESQVGTMDLDLGLTVAFLNEGRYQALTERLRRAGFSQDENEDPPCQRWKTTGTAKVTVDLLIQPTRPGELPGSAYLGRPGEPPWGRTMLPTRRTRHGLIPRPHHQGTETFAERGQQPHLDPLVLCTTEPVPPRHA